MFKQRQPASSKNGSLVITVEGSQSERNIPGSDVTSWTKLVLDMYPPGTSVRYASALQICVLDVLINDNYECWLHAGIPSFGLLKKNDQRSYNYLPITNLSKFTAISFMDNLFFSCNELKIRTFCRNLCKKRTLFHHYGGIWLLFTFFLCHNCSLHEQSIAMIVIDVFFSLTIIVFGLGHALAGEIIVDFGEHFILLWYIFEETALCIWTGILYITYLKANISRAWWKDVIMILLLVTLSFALIFLLLLLIFHSYLILTNQTTYELIRRRRIPYLRGIPERVYPFSEGVCRNLYKFCCARSSIYGLERLPTAMELEDKSRPYTCLGYLTCRCC
ncbi:hypothetical protein NC653_013520 [Populus alba x Populus x berolinensis]|uniref:S-acyltransferase n=1 Tax=Populus alba x Populus x berolinensis TaxID=444605 RepID=A0AAD6QUZ0_9ROSI|nr:hypothetical protein NC653_013520 [Populus alba x Populus x berolinensis]